MHHQTSMSRGSWFLEYLGIRIRCCQGLMHSARAAPFCRDRHQPVDSSLKSSFRESTQNRKRWTASPAPDDTTTNSSQFPRYQPLIRGFSLMDNPIPNTRLSLLNWDSLQSAFKMPPKASKAVKVKHEEPHGYEFGGPYVYNLKLIANLYWPPSVSAHLASLSDFHSLFT